MSMRVIETVEPWMLRSLTMLSEMMSRWSSGSSTWPRAVITAPSLMVSGIWSYPFTLDPRGPGINDVATAFNTIANNQFVAHRPF